MPFRFISNWGLLRSFEWEHVKWRRFEPLVFTVVIVLTCSICTYQIKSQLRYNADAGRKNIDELVFQLKTTSASNAALMAELSSVEVRIRKITDKQEDYDNSIQEIRQILRNNAAQRLKDRKDDKESRQ